jgi:hypothetical protein
MTDPRQRGASSLRRIVGALGLALSWIAGCHSSSPPVRGLASSDIARVANARTEIAYIGASRCASCHRDAEGSYLHTAHAYALAEIDLASEPPDGEFVDSSSRRHYRIYRKDGALRHEESIHIEAGSPVILCDLPVRYAIGSGRFSRSYLVERDGFLFESPATWFASPREWNLSPGYAGANLGFQRPAELRCLFCHAGRVEPIERSPQRLALPALTIDCERCHGPGELHARKWDAMSARADAGRDVGPKSVPDDTIFNPAKAERQRGEDVCAQCHLHSAATVEVRGKNLLDFRPGQQLSDYLAHYASQRPKTQMEVVGHVEQLRLSRCYQGDARLTCLTCHDVHAPPSQLPTPASYRQKCLECHSDQACRAPAETRRATALQDDCVACHMPRSPTEIPHFAFTHHRIAIHTTTVPVERNAERDELVLIPGSPVRSPLDEVRNRGLGYLQLSDAPGQAIQGKAHRADAERLLRQVQQQGPPDSEVDAALARLSWGVDPWQTLTHAKAVVAVKDASPEAWTTACFTLGATYYGLNRPAEARSWLAQSVKLRPTADVYVMLSDCCAFAGDLPAALVAMRTACELAPDRPAYCQRLIELLRATGAVAEADSLQPRFKQLLTYRQQMDGRQAPRSD